MLHKQRYPTKTVIEKHTCDFHKKRPGDDYPGCGCSISYRLVELTGEEKEEQITKDLLERMNKLKKELEEIERKLFMYRTDSSL